MLLELCIREELSDLDGEKQTPCKDQVGQNVHWQRAEGVLCYCAGHQRMPWTIWGWAALRTASWTSMSNQVRALLEAIAIFIGHAPGKNSA